MLHECIFTIAYFGTDCVNLTILPPSKYNDEVFHKTTKPKDIRKVILIFLKDKKAHVTDIIYMMQSSQN